MGFRESTDRPPVCDQLAMSLSSVCVEFSFDVRLFRAGLSNRSHKDPEDGYFLAGESLF